VALIVSAMFICIGVYSITDGGDLLFGVFWLCIPLFIFVATLNYLTTNGEFTLIFESNDPFSNEDAGDCGSGDGGGCGD